MVTSKANLGPRFDKFTITTENIFTLTEEGKYFAIKRFDLKDINAAPHTIFETSRLILKHS
jgi:hypothetical protein